MKIFDAHCDTVIKVMGGSLAFETGQGEGQLCLPGMIAAGSCAQVFACFVLSAHYPGIERETAEAMIKTIEQMASQSDGRMRIARSASQLAEFCAKGPIAAIIGLEGADPLEGKAENLRHFYDLGVRDIIPAWRDNQFSGTAFGTNTPLTEQGRELIALAEELSMMVDVSHLSDKAFADVCAITKRPFIASHSNCRALCPSKRNLTDSMIRELAARGGVMGINLAADFLDPDFFQKKKTARKESLARVKTPEGMGTFRARVASWPRPSIDWVGRHVLYAINTGGEDCIGLGGDLDGNVITPLEIDKISDYAKLVDLLDSKGLSTRQIEKVCYSNFERVFTDVLPD